MFLPSNNKCKSFQKTLKEKTLKYYLYNYGISKCNIRELL